MTATTIQHRETHTPAAPVAFAPRVQLRRVEGWCKPDDTVVVARRANGPGRWGNPFPVGQVVTVAGAEVHVQDAATAVALYRRHLQTSPELVAEIRAELAGRPLACWCPLSAPCHADVLRYVAGGGDPGPLPAITVRPPWSQIIAEAEALAAAGAVPKLCENRGRAVNPAYIGCDIAIHAGQTWCEFGEHDPRVRAAWARFAASIPLRPDAPGADRTGFVNSLLAVHRRSSLWIERGAIVAVARLVDCHPARVAGDGTVCCAPWGERYHSDRVAHHLVLDRVRRLPGPALPGGDGDQPHRGPVRARGYRAVPFMLAPDVDAAVLRQLLALPAVAGAVVPR